MRNIRPKQAHVAALEWALGALRDAAAEVNEKHETALYDLLDRMRQAAQPSSSEPAGLSPGRFVELAREHLPTYAPPVKPTQPWYAKIGRMIKDAGLTEESAAVMLRHVARWARLPLTTETLLAKAPAWAAQAAKAGELAEADTSRPPAGLFDEEGE